MMHKMDKRGGLYSTGGISKLNRDTAPLPNPSCTLSLSLHLDRTERVGNGPIRFPAASICTEIMAASIHEKAI